MSLELDICEIYETLMGESSRVGWPCTLIRMGRCNLHCTYCDTRYALTDYKRLSLEKILRQVSSPFPHHVLVTGGEPLLQSGTEKLLQLLLARGHKVCLETNGSLDVGSLDPRVVKIIDIKCPSSRQSEKNLYQNLRYVTPQDEVKFVIADREDFCWAQNILKKYSIQNQVTVLFSPVDQYLEPKELAKWILAEGLEVKLQIQLHKILWGDKRGV
jgi:7-carboxy-7-deazaguanine synthase